MPIGQGNALWNIQRVFSHTRSVRETETSDAKSVPSSSSFWKPANVSSLFLRRFSSTPCHSPKRSASAPQGLPQKLPPNQESTAYPGPSAIEESTHASCISKSTSVPHTFTLKPSFLEIHPNPRLKSSDIPSTSKSTHSISPSNSPLDSPSSLDFISPAHPACQNLKEPPLAVSNESETLSPKHSPSESPSPQLTSKKITDLQDSVKKPTHVVHSSSPTSPSLYRPKTNASQSKSCRHASCSSSHSSPTQSPLKSSSSPLSSRRVSIQGEQLPVTPSPPWSELMEARRRLVAVECRRRALSALEMRVQQVHYVFLQAEMRVARQREGLAKLVEAAGRAEVQTAVHGQRIRKALRRHKPRLLACALCVPCPAKAERRSAQHPRHSRCALFQGRIQVLRGCVGNDEHSARD